MLIRVGELAQTTGGAPNLLMPDTERKKPRSHGASLMEALGFCWFWSQNLANNTAQHQSTNANSERCLNSITVHDDRQQEGSACGPQATHCNGEANARGSQFYREELRQICVRQAASSIFSISTPAKQANTKPATHAIITQTKITSRANSARCFIGSSPYCLRR